MAWFRCENTLTKTQRDFVVRKPITTIGRSAGNDLSREPGSCWRPLHAVHDRAWRALREWSSGAQGGAHGRRLCARGRLAADLEYGGARARC